jgi:hypothetical protein
MTPKALIFDVDGTLAETEDLHRRAFNAAFADAGLPWVWDRALYTALLETTGGKERIAAFQRDVLGGEPVLTWDAIVALHADKTERYVALMNDGALALRPGVGALIDAARQAGLRLAIATTRRGRKQETRPGRFQPRARTPGSVRRRLPGVRRLPQRPPRRDGRRSENRGDARPLHRRPGLLRSRRRPSDDAAVRQDRAAGLTSGRGTLRTVGRTAPSFA